MRQLFFFAAFVALSVAAIAKVFTGALKQGEVPVLPLELTVSPSGSITLCSPAQSPAQIPAKVLFRSNDSLSLSFMTIGARLQLKGDTVAGYTGTLLQNRQTFSVDLEPKAKEPVVNVPYTTREVAVPNGDVTLAGTLTCPEDMNEQTPLVVMVTGSGKQNRDEALFSHRPFADIADYLARNGIATYRYDDRGSFGSTAGKPEDETTTGYATDATAVLKAMRDLEITRGPIGILGHSEGGMIAWMAPGSDFVISLAGPAVRGDSILLYQAEVIGHVSRHELSARKQLMQAVVDGREITDSLVHEIDPEGETEAAILSKMLVQSPWMREFIRYSPAEDIKRLSRRGIPVLALYFGNDAQVPVEMNLNALKKLAPNFTIQVIEGVNHILVDCEDGSPTLYATLPGPTSEKVLTAIVDFIRQPVSTQQ